MTMPSLRWAEDEEPRSDRGVSERSDRGGSRSDRGVSEQYVYEDGTYPTGSICTAWLVLFRRDSLRENQMTIFPRRHQDGFLREKFPEVTDDDGFPERPSSRRCERRAAQAQSWTFCGSTRLRVSPSSGASTRRSFFPFTVPSRERMMPDDPCSSTAAGPSPVCLAGLSA